MATLNFSDSSDDDNEPDFQSRLGTTLNRSAKKQWFITYPHSGVLTRERFLKAIRELFPVEKAQVVLEPHKECHGGDDHLHAQIQFKRKVTLAALREAIVTVFPKDLNKIHFKPLGPKKWLDQLLYCLDPRKNKDCDLTPLWYNMTNPLAERLTPAEVYHRDHPHILKWMNAEECRRGWSLSTPHYTSKERTYDSTLPIVHETRPSIVVTPVADLSWTTSNVLPYN